MCSIFFRCYKCFSSQLCSQVVQVEAQIITGFDLVVKGIIGNLMSVHNRPRYFNRPHEVKVVVTLVVSELLNVLLSQESSVFDHMVMDG
jgi:hypothetical protein